MPAFLMILEVSRKQDYIFSAQKLRENAQRSEEICYATSSGFFAEAAGQFYQESRNLVYSGGGHTVLQFDDRPAAQAFAALVTGQAMTRFPGMELFVKIMPFDPQRSVADNLKQLSARLEEKKSQRKHSFRRMSLGLETLDLSFRPAAERAEGPCAGELLPPPAGWRYPIQFSDLTDDDGMIAVVHIDGNAMGARVNQIYDSCGSGWEECCDALRSFSTGVQQDFEQAFREMTAALLDDPEVSGGRQGLLPVRPVILAGDDVCFVSTGKLALECARIFLQKLSARRNAQDGLPYAACAGVVLIHEKYPFHAAYDLSEELCSNAKRLGAQLGLDPQQASRLSAMDWHIQFGQLKDGLSQLRRDYQTEDGGRLELRPVTVVVPPELTLPEGADLRSYEFFCALNRTMAEEKTLARGKLKELRTALKQGEVESRYYFADRRISALLDCGFDARYDAGDRRKEAYQRMMAEKPVFMQLGEERRCLFFDAIEMMDHHQMVEEGEA